MFCSFSKKNLLTSENSGTAKYFFREEGLLSVKINEEQFVFGFWNELKAKRPKKEISIYHALLMFTSF